MGQSIIINPQLAWFIYVVGGLALPLAGWAVRALFRRMDRNEEERTARMDRDKAEVLELFKQSDRRAEERSRASDDQRDRDKAELLKRMDRDKAEVLGLFKQSDERGEERSRATDDRRDRDKAEVLERMDRGKAEVLGLFKQSDERNGGHHRETQSALRELSYRVGRLEGSVGVSDSGEPRSGRHSPRRDDNPSSVPDSEPERAQVVERYAGSMVSSAGGGSEPARAAGLAHQAVPSQEQDGQHAGETGPESGAEKSPDETG